jgi:hypothetical protein
MMIRFSNLPFISWTPLSVAPAGDGGTGGGPSASSYGEDDLNSFAVAAVKVHRINNQYSRKMQLAKSEPEKHQLEQRASDEMMQAVQDEGLSVDTYQTIASCLDSDDVLAEKVKHKIRKVA